MGEIPIIQQSSSAFHAEKHWQFNNVWQCIMGYQYHKEGLSNIVVSYNPTDPWPKPPTQKIFWDFWGKIAKRNISAMFSSR